MTAPTAARALCAAALLLSVPASAAAQRAGMMEPAGVPRGPEWQPALLAGFAEADALLADDMAQARGRYTRRGLVIGAAAGAATGLVIGGFIALFCYSENDSCPGAIPLVTVFGAASGAAAGAIIGAAIPRPIAAREDTPDPATPADPRAPRAPRRRIGSAAVAGGVAHATLHEWDGPFFDGTGTAIRANFLAELRPWFAIGPEAGVAGFGDGGTVRHIALAVRTTADLGQFRPYLIGNLGAYDVSVSSLEFLGGALGAGIRWEPGDRFFVDVEARAQRNAQNIEPMRMRAFSVGGGMYW